MINNQYKIILVSIITLCNSLSFGFQKPTRTYEYRYDPSYMLNNSSFYLGSIVINSIYPNISYQITKNGYQLFSNAKLKNQANALGKNILAELKVTGPQGVGVEASDAKLSNDRLLDDKGTLKLVQSDNTGINLMGLQLQYSGPTSSANNIILQSIGDPSLMASATLFVYKFFEILPIIAPSIFSTLKTSDSPDLKKAASAQFLLNLYFDPATGEVHFDSIDALIPVYFSLSNSIYGQQSIHIDKQTLINNNIIVEQGE